MGCANAGLSLGKGRTMESNVKGVAVSRLAGSAR